MKTETILIIILIVLIVAVIAVVMMNQGPREVEELRDEIKEMKKSEVASELEELRSEIKDLKENQVDEPEPVIEDVEDEVVYLKSAAAVDVQSPDIEKNNFPIESDEVRASVMEKQNIVENDVKKNFEKSDAKIAPRVINKGPDSMNLNQKLPQITMEKMQAAKYNSRDKEKNEEVRQAISARQAFASARHVGPMLSPKLIRMGPPKMVDEIEPKNPKGKAAKHIRMGPPKMVLGGDLLHHEIDTFGPKAKRKVPEIGPKSPKGKAAQSPPGFQLGYPDAAVPGQRRGKLFEQLPGKERGMVKPAVCRDLPGSPFDSCGRPSSFGPVRAATQLGLKKT